jgi:NNP family nitrate/nitrite transporter-like MFS transporter
MAKACPTPQPFRAAIGTIVFITSLFFLMFVSRMIFPALFPAMQQDPAVSLTPAQAGSLFFFAAIGGFVASVFAGMLSSLINHRGSMILSVFLVAATLFAAYFAKSLWTLRAVFFVLGASAGLHQPSSIATLTASVRTEDWGKALSIQQLGPPLSLVAGPLFAVGLLHWFSWNESLLWLAGLTAVLGVAFLIFKRGVGSFPGDPPSPAMMKPVLSTLSFWLMIFLFALGMGSQVGVYSLLPLYLSAERGMTLDHANTLLGLANIAPLVTVFLAGWVTIRIGEKRMMIASLFLTGVSMFLVGALSGAALAVCVVLMAAFAVCFFPPAFAALSHIVQPNYRSLAAAFGPPAGFMLGGGLLPTLLGYMGEAWSFSTGIMIIGAVVAIGSVAAVGLKLLTNLEEGC